MSMPSHPPASSASSNRAARRISRGPSWSSLQAWVWQLVVVGTVGLLMYLLVRNTLLNLERRHVTTGFAFLGRITGIPLASSFLDYDPTTSSYGKAFAIGIVNTLRLWAVCAVAATILGVTVGLVRFSPNWLLRTAASVYVGVIRNVPCLLQILFWVGLIEKLGPPDQAVRLMPGVFLSNRGVALPWIEAASGFGWTLLTLGFGALVLIVRWSLQRDRSKKLDATRWGGAGMAVLFLAGLPLLVFILTGHPAQLDVPEASTFDFIGGAQITSEFAALAIGLSIYASGYIAEVVRAGVLALPRGQWEAAASINLSRIETLRWVVLPQALRVILPPMTSQYLSLLKNSSLAIVIGYQDIVAVANLSLTQTGQAIESVLIIMAVYLVISAPLTLLMNFCNERVAHTGVRK
jgi:general L-amino acid transport system permease protein